MVRLVSGLGHPVHLSNTEQRQVAVDPQNKQIDLGRESACRLLSSTPTADIYYYCPVQKLVFVLSSNGWMQKAKFADSKCVGWTCRGPVRRKKEGVEKTRK